MEREFLAWQTRSAVHRLALERCTDTWQQVGGLTLSSYASAAKAERRRSRSRAQGLRWPVPLVAALTVAVVLFTWAGDDTYASGVGEQRIISLSDGSRMSLNTSTRVRVDFTAERRTVQVDDGEVLFEVAKDMKRPFVVQVGSTEVVATGTEFLVRYDRVAAGDGALAVTLVEGRVIVRGSEGGVSSASAKPLVMEPGEQVRVGRPSPRPAAIHLERTVIDRALAWRHGYVVFDGATLPDAVAEMNRYSNIQIALGRDDFGTLLVSGSYRAGDSVGFANALARLFGFAVLSHGDHVELVR